MDRACCGQWRRRPYSGYFASSGAIVSTDDAFQSRAGARARQARLVHGWQVTPAARRLWLALALAGRAAWRGTSWHRRSRMEPKPGDVVGARQGAAARASPPSDPSRLPWRGMAGTRNLQRQRPPPLEMAGAAWMRGSPPCATHGLSVPPITEAQGFRIPDSSGSGAGRLSTPTNCNRLP